MTNQEFEAGFDVYFNNITSNQAPGLNIHEKSLLLTKAQDEIVLDTYTANSKGNNIQQGFDDSAKRQADFSMLMKVSNCKETTISGSTISTIKKYTCSGETGTIILYDTDITFTSGGAAYQIANGTYTVTNGTITIAGDPDVTVTVTGFPWASGTMVVADEQITSNNGKIDDRSKVYAFPHDVFIIVNETIKTTAGKYVQINPLRYDEYYRLMKKPFKRPDRYEAWRLLNSGVMTNGQAVKIAEIILFPGDSISNYQVRYIRRPRPIVLGDLDGLTINGIGTNSECEVDPILHEAILQRAVELAKISWTATGQDNAQMVMAAGQRSE